ncbi:unnamed protein product [Nezara viridula]|uniref:Uncharacterized protein n=1 Tax=Nezara viridula TaxID=85310 RepID=A0A9P0EAZ1_NEZVI|nr:unnamed protein product [Nezara viridula]
MSNCLKNLRTTDSSQDIMDHIHHLGMISGLLACPTPESDRYQPTIRHGLPSFLQCLAKGNHPSSRQPSAASWPLKTFNINLLLKLKSSTPLNRIGATHGIRKFHATPKITDDFVRSGCIRENTREITATI